MADSPPENKARVRRDRRRATPSSARRSCRRCTSPRSRRATVSREAMEYIARAARPVARPGPRHGQLLHDVPLQARGEDADRGLHHALLRARRGRRADRAHVPQARDQARRDDGRRQVHRQARRVPGRLRRRARGAGRTASGSSTRTDAGHRPRPRRRDASTAPSTGRRARASTILFRNVWKEDSTSIATYKAGGGYAKLEKNLKLTPDEIIETVKKSSLRGPRRRRLPDRPQVELPAQGQPEAPLPLRERRRERARHLQGPRDHRARPAPAHRGHASSRRYAIRSKTALHLHPRRVPRGRPHPRQGADGGLRRGLRGQEHPRHRRRRRHRTSTAAPAPTSAARRRRSSRASRASAASRASSRPSRRSSASTAARPSSTTSRRSLNVPLILDTRRRVVRGLRHREERRAEALLDQRPRRSARAATKRRWARSRCAS